MAVTQPIATDRLNSPSHSKLHRVISASLSAADQTIKVNDNSSVEIVGSAGISTQYLLFGPASSSFTSYTQTTYINTAASTAKALNVASGKGLAFSGVIEDSGNAQAAIYGLVGACIDRNGSDGHSIGCGISGESTYAGVGNHTNTRPVVGVNGVAINNSASIMGNGISLLADAVQNIGGGTVQLASGVYCPNQTVASVRNHGIWIAETAGATRWAVYADGGAQSYFAGNIGIGNTTPAAQLDLVKTALIVADFNQVLKTINLSAGDTLASVISADKTIIASSGISASTGGAVMVNYQSVRPHASDAASVSYMNQIYSLEDSSGVPLTAMVGSGMALGIVFQGAGWAAHVATLSDNLSIVAGANFTNDHGKSVTIQASDGVGTDKNGGNVTILAGNETGTGNMGQIIMTVSSTNATGGISFGKTVSGTPTPQIQYNITTGLQAIVNGQQIGLGRITAPAQVSAGDTVTLTVGTNDPRQLYDFAAGGGAYTYNIDLIKGTGQIEGNTFQLKVTKAASTNPTIVIRNGSGGSALRTINSASAEVWTLEYVLDGTNWIETEAVKND